MAKQEGVLSRFIKRFAAPSGSISITPQGVPNTEKTVEIGRAGTQDYHGFIAQDFNSKFNGDSAIRTYDEMRKTDGTVAGVIRALKLPIISSDYMIESADSDDQTQKDIAEFVRKNLMEELEGGFAHFVEEALNYLVFGFYYFEKVYKIDKGQLKLKKLGPRLPSAHYRWIMQSNPKVPGVTQLLPVVPYGDEVGSTIREIPFSKLVLFTNEREGDNYEGISILRSAYKHWYFKDTLYRIDGIKHERGAGILTIGLPEGSSDADRAAATELGENFKINEQGFIIKPSPNWTAELMTAGIADQSAALMESVKHHDRMITTNILAQFLDLGASGGGSYSLSKDQSSFFGLAVQAVAEYMQSVINEQIIKELVTMNFGEQEEYPKFSFAGVGEIDYTEMADVLQKLTQAGLVKKDPQLKVWIHKNFGLPEVTVEDFEDDEEDDGEGEDPQDPMQPMNPLQQDQVMTRSKDMQGMPKMEKKEDGDDGAELAEKKYYRPLTLAEKRVKFAEVAGMFDDDEQALEAILAAQSEATKAKLVKEIERILENDDIGAVDRLSVETEETALANKVIAAAKKSLEDGKRTAANELEVAIPVTTNYTKKVLETKINLYLARRATALETAVKERLVDLLNNDVGKAAAMFELQQIIDDESASQNSQLVGRVVVDSFDEGRALTFKDIEPMLYGLQRSEILDDATCAMCLTIDGRVLSPADPFTNIGQIHTNCRGMWVGVLKTDAELPDITPLPKSIKNKFETTEGVPSTNDFKQIKKPIVRKNSRLEQKIKDGDIEV